VDQCCSKTDLLSIKEHHPHTKVVNVHDLLMFVGLMRSTVPAGAATSPSSTSARALARQARCFVNFLIRDEFSRRCIQAAAGSHQAQVILQLWLPQDTCTFVTWRLCSKFGQQPNVQLPILNPIDTLQLPLMLAA
jgi:hypothetical protein